MSSDNRFGDEPSMAEILASVRKIVADDKSPTESSADKLETQNTTNYETSESEPSNRGDILERLLRKQANSPDVDALAQAEQDNSNQPLVADISSALHFQPQQSVSRSIDVEPTLSIPTVTSDLESDEIQILDLTNPIKKPLVSTPSKETVTPEENTSEKSEPSLNLTQAIQAWADGPGNETLRKLIREEISAVFKSTFKD